MLQTIVSFENVKTVTLKLLAYCQENEWAGFDPYDGLNSKVFQLLRFLHHKYPRLALIQFMKISPVNIRRLLLVPKSQNPKAIALFLVSCIKLARLGFFHDKESIRMLANRLIELSTSYGGLSGWGYNFDWQAKTGFVRRGIPNIICTTSAGQALLDAYNYFHEARFMDKAVETARFIQHHFFIETNDSAAFYNYLPRSIDTKKIFPIHNASLLGASFIVRVARDSGDKAMLPHAFKAVKFSLDKQHDDGSWDYGEWDSPSNRWIDNFHTGFNLCALRQISCDTGALEFEPHVRRGFDFYRKHFFAKDGAPKYYHDKLYPIDIHSSAQSIITFVTLKDLDKNNIPFAKSVLKWTLLNMYSRRGYFYFQKRPWWISRISYMRWNQAWMLLALTTLLEDFEGKRG